LKGHPTQKNTGQKNCSGRRGRKNPEGMQGVVGVMILHIQIFRGQSQKEKRKSNRGGENESNREVGETVWTRVQEEKKMGRGVRGVNLRGSFKGE